MGKEILIQSSLIIYQLLQAKELSNIRNFDAITAIRNRFTDETVQNIVSNVKDSKVIL